MNPGISQAVVDRAFEDDPASAAAEWGAQFRSDVETLFAREALDAVVVRGRFELPPVPGVSYIGFVDPSGGSADSFTLAIAHRDPAGVPVLDLMREAKPPFSPEAVTAEFAGECRRYNVGSVTGDKYAGEWPREQFRKCGIEYVTSELTRSELYLEALPMVNSSSVELLDNSRLLGQLAGLERRVGRSGRDAIDHRPASHDDCANAAAGALIFATRSIALATLPDTFRACNRAASMPFAAASCYIFGGTFPGVNDAICSNCVGHRFVLAARQAQESRTGEHLALLTFYRERLDWKAHPFVERMRHSAWMSRDHGL
jgi:hypothetical protein